MESAREEAHVPIAEEEGMNVAEESAVREQARDLVAEEEGMNEEPVVEEEGLNKDGRSTDGVEDMEVSAAADAELATKSIRYS